MAASAHQCTQDQTIGRLQAIQENVRERIEEHHNTLYGNGKPGLVAEMQDIKTWRANMETRSKEVRQTRNAILVLIATVIIEIAVNLMKG